MTGPVNDSIDRINELWRLHDPSETAPKATPPCLAFAVDGRFVEQDGVRYRLGVSFGGNPFTPEDSVGFVPPPVVPGRFALGLHVVGTEGVRLDLYDQWYDAREVGPDVADPAEGLEAARAWLRSIPDEGYADIASPGPGAVTLGREPERDVEAFKVHGGEADPAARWGGITELLDLL